MIFATPTGSTAYSLAAGSSVIHPTVPVSGNHGSLFWFYVFSTYFSHPDFFLLHRCILLTPICPHVLSFRFMVFPDHVVLRCYVPDDARTEASVVFDGKHRQELRRGDSVQIQMSAYPFSTINKRNHPADWLDSRNRDSNFNARTIQKPL